MCYIYLASSTSPVDLSRGKSIISSISITIQSREKDLHENMSNFSSGHFREEGTRIFDMYEKNSSLNLTKQDFYSTCRLIYTFIYNMNTLIRYLQVVIPIKNIYFYLLYHLF